MPDVNIQDVLRNNELTLSYLGEQTVLGSTANVKSIDFANNGSSLEVQASVTGNATVYLPSAGGSLLTNVNLSAGTTSQNLSNFVLSNANNVSFGLNGSTVTATATVATSLTNVNVSAGTTSNNLSAITFSNSNRVSFGLNGSTITAQHALNFSAGTTSQNVSDQLIFSNSNGVSFGLNGSTVTGSVATSLTNVNVSAGTTSNNLSAFVLSNSNDVSFGLNGSTVTASANSLAVAAGTQTATSGTVVLSNSNGISFGMSNSSVITANHAVYLSYFEELAIGGTTVNTLPNNTVFFQPMVVENSLTVFRLNLMQSLGSVSQAPQLSYSTAILKNFTSTVPGNAWNEQLTVMLWSRLSTGTNANTSVLQTFFSTTASMGLGISHLISNTNSTTTAQGAGASTTRYTISATLSYTTQSQEVFSYIANVGSNGAYTTSTASTLYASGSSSTSQTFGLSTATSATSVFTSLSSSGSTTNAGVNDFFAASYTSGLRPLYVGMATSLPPGEFWLGLQLSTAQTTTAYSGGAFSAESLVCFSNDPQGGSALLEYGATSTVQSSAIRQGWGSHSNTSGTTTTYALSAISEASGIQTWFNMVANTR